MYIKTEAQNQARPNKVVIPQIAPIDIKTNYENIATLLTVNERIKMKTESQSSPNKNLAISTPRIL